MALPRIFDQRSFKGQGALISTRALFGGLTKPPIDLTDVPKLVFLRWQLNPRIGMPVEPFKVWRRPAMPLEEPMVQVQVIAVPPLGFVVMLPKPMVSVTVGLQVGAAGASGNVLPLADGIGFENVLAVLPYTLAANGSTILRFQANYITGLFVLGGATVAAVSGFPLAAAEKIGGWELVETVGLPVDEGQWADLAPQTHGIKQGLVGAEVAASDAAAQRMSRGINPFGWYQAYPTGQIAPKWDLPGAADLIKDADEQLLPLLHKAMFLPAGDQAGFTSDFTIDPPQNPAGQKMSGAPGKATVAPLTLLQMAVSTDPLQAVALGFGTGYQHEDIPPIHLGSMSLFNDKGVSDWDFMITGRWREGEGNNAKDVEYAALIRRPRLVLPPPAPADLALDFLSHHQPVVPDAAWTASVRLSWERLELDNLTRVASFAAARFDQAQPGTPATALMERRATAPGHHFVGDAQNPDDPEQVRQSASDSAYPIPNAPGSVSALYGVSTQNIFGIWSPWVTVPFNNSQPAPDLVQIVDASLVPTDPGPPATVCATELRMEFVLDWRARRVGSVTFRGRLFAAATRFDDPPAGMPGNLQTSLAGASRNLTVTFAGDVPSVTGATIQALNDQGSAVVAPGSAQGTSRRYRMTVPGFALDFAATPHVGLALQGRLQESLAPARLSAWSPSKLAYGSDPRARPAPPLSVVPLTSLPDAAGEGHARLHWTALPGAAGYVVYTSNEFVILDRTGQPRAAPEATLSERLVAMNAAFNADPDRNAFTRVNDTPLTATSLDVDDTARLAGDPCVDRAGIERRRGRGAVAGRGGAVGRVDCLCRAEDRPARAAAHRGAADRTRSRIRGAGAGRDAGGFRGAAEADPALPDAGRRCGAGGGQHGPAAGRDRRQRGAVDHHAGSADAGRLDRHGDRDGQRRTDRGNTSGTGQRLWPIRCRSAGCWAGGRWPRPPCRWWCRRRGRRPCRHWLLSWPGGATGRRAGSLLDRCAGEGNPARVARVRGRGAGAGAGRAAHPGAPEVGGDFGQCARGRTRVGPVADRAGAVFGAAAPGGRERCRQPDRAADRPDRAGRASGSRRSTRARC